MDAALEWGLPDWQDPAAYGDTGKWSLGRWRWEFLRRRPDLRAQFEELVDIEEEYIRQYCDHFSDRNMLGFFVPSYDINPNYPVPESPRALPLFNPRLGEQPEDLLQWHDWNQVRYTFLSEEAPTGYLRIDLDIRSPIEPQIAFARKRLAEEQLKIYGKKLQKRRHPNKWLLYLRVLDGNEVGASWSEIAAILPPTMARTEQAARDVWEAASALRFNF